jgi:protein-S-isoprenylcysteine O-methyltransferase Ste14
MNAKSEIPPAERQTNPRAGILARFVQIAFVFVFQALVLFLSAGRLNWTWAWLFLGICVVSVSINARLMLRTNPETIAERGRPKEMRKWDKVVGGLWGLAMYLLVPLVAGLDERFGWTRGLSASGNIAGGALLAVGLALGGWAMIANAYFSTAVRIQTDRGQTVCCTGPYKFVRHPGYVGFILQSLATPFLLGSLWALIPGVTGVVLIIIRTAFEDRMLQAELPGYKDYVQEVRHRLLPGIW